MVFLWGPSGLDASGQIRHSLPAVEGNGGFAICGELADRDVQLQVHSVAHDQPAH